MSPDIAIFAILFLLLAQGEFISETCDEDKENEFWSRLSDCESLAQYSYLIGIAKGKMIPATCNYLEERVSYLIAILKITNNSIISSNVLKKLNLNMIACRTNNPRICMTTPFGMTWKLLKTTLLFSETATLHHVQLWSTLKKTTWIDTMEKQVVALLKSKKGLLKRRNVRKKLTTFKIFWLINFLVKGEFQLSILSKYDFTINIFSEPHFCQWYASAISKLRIVRKSTESVRTLSIEQSKTPEMKQPMLKTRSILEKSVSMALLMQTAH